MIRWHFQNFENLLQNRLLTTCKSFNPTQNSIISEKSNERKTHNDQQQSREEKNYVHMILRLNNTTALSKQMST